MNTSSGRTFCSVLLVAMTAWLLAGCAPLSTYQIGSKTLFPRDVHTVYVPIFESDSFRMHLGEKMTEAVVKEIELRTNFKVVGNAHADSVLTGRIVSDQKRVLVESYSDEARESEFSLMIQVVWTRRNGDLLMQHNIPVTPAMLNIAKTSSVVPEYGESIASGQQDVIVKTARQIVSMMENPW